MQAWGSLYTFEPYTRKHALLVLGLVLLAGVVISLGRRAVARWGAGVEQAAGVVLLLVWFISAAWDFAVPGATSRTTLPLHWCDLTGILAGVVLLRPSADTRAALHFWGICFTSIAFISPVESRGPAFLGFWIYFVSHGAILTAVAYDWAVRGYRPRWQEAAKISLMTLVWVALVMPFNLLLGANYAYVGAISSNQRDLVSFFGPWPQRLLPLYLTATALMLVLTFLQRGRRERTQLKLVVDPQFDLLDEVELQLRMAA